MAQERKQDIFADIASDESLTEALDAFLTVSDLGKKIEQVDERVTRILLLNERNEVKGGRLLWRDEVKNLVWRLRVERTERRPLKLAKEIEAGGKLRLRAVYDGEGALKVLQVPLWGLAPNHSLMLWDFGEKRCFCSLIDVNENTLLDPEELMIKVIHLEVTKKVSYRRSWGYEFGYEFGINRGFLRRDFSLLIRMKDEHSFLDCSVPQKTAKPEKVLRAMPGKQRNWQKFFQKTAEIKVEWC